MASFKDWDAFARAVSKALDDAFNRTGLRILGELMADVVRQRTRRGYGVAVPGKAKSRLKRLSPTYIKFRRRNKSKLSPETSPRKSNLTFTGSMLDDLQTRNVFTRKKEFVLGFSSRKNRQKARWAAERGRPFLNFSKSEEKILTDAYEDVLGKAFRANRL